MLIHGYRHTELIIYMERQKPSIANTILKENKVGGPTLPDFKIHYKLQ